MIIPSDSVGVKDWFLVLVENNRELIHSECAQMISESSVFPLRLMFNLLDRSYPSNFGRCGGISPILDNLEKNIFEGGLEIKKLSPNLNHVFSQDRISYIHGVFYPKLPVLLL